MRESRPETVRARARRLALFLLAVGLSGPALAQYMAAAPPRVAPLTGMVETPAAALSRNLRLIAENPRNVVALVAAGRAALGLGDFQAAVGFFGRAEEVSPNDPAPKIGMGAASVQMGDSAAALQFFLQAQQLGASAAAMGADRGLAHDLNGNQGTAQADYRAALAGPDRDEARRRLALSLGISGERSSAFATLQPLLMRRDPAAARVRAFVLALVGDRAGARSAIEAAMPGSAARIDPFFAMLPTLSAEQKAAAVHLGVFPTSGEIRVAAATPVRPAPSPVTVAPRPQPAFVPPPVAVVPQPQPVSVPPPIQSNSPALATITPPPAATFTLPSASVPSSPPITTIAASTIVATPVPDPSPPATDTSTLPTSTLASMPSTDGALPAGDRLSGIDKLLAEVSEAAPPPPRPKVETADPEAAPPPPPQPKVETADPRRAAAAKKLADSKKAEAKKAADAKKAEAVKAAAAKKEREALGVAGSNWVQLAGGSNADRMGTEYRKLTAKSSALKKRSAHVTQGKDYFRLLVGPFDSKGAAQTFVNSLAKDGVDGFSWTRTPATIKIEKLGT